MVTPQTWMTPHVIILIKQMMSLKGWPHGIHLVLQHSPLDVYLNEKLKTNTHRHSQYVLFDASLKTFLGKPSGTKPRLKG